MTKYLRFCDINYSSDWSGIDVCGHDNTPAHRVCETVQMLTCETPDFILQLSGQSTVLTSTRQTTKSERSCKNVCTTARFMTLPSWNRVWSKNRNILIRWWVDHWWSSHGVKFTSLSLHLSTWMTFWTHDFIMFEFCTLTVTCLNVANNGQLMFSGDFAKLCYNFCRCWQILLKFGDLYAIKCYTVGAEFS